MGLQAEGLPVFGQRIAPTLIGVFYYLGLSAVAIACSCRRLAGYIFWTIGVPLGFIDACGRSELLGSALERCGTPRSDMRLLTRDAGRAVPMGDALLDARI